MKATVIIPTKNPGAIFKSVLAAVLKQRTPWDCEVLVIDSGSTDGTADYVAAQAGVRLHRIEPAEFGHGRTRNLGIEMARGEFAALLTHDALPADEHWLKELVAAAGQADEVAGAFGRHRAYPASGPYISRDLEAHFDAMRNGSPLFRLDDPERYRVDMHYRRHLHFFSSNNACIRKSIWRQLPLPDVEFAEDQIWAKTIIEAGYTKAYADAAVVYHSHSYGPVEACRRAFDESKALRELFGYQSCPSLRALAKQALRAAKRDLRYSRRNKRLGRDMSWLLRSPLQHAAINLGAYLGERADELPPWLRNTLSRDKRIFYGRQMG